jgi:hypothetical protein
MSEDSIYISRSSTIAARVLAGEMMVMNSADSTFFTLNEVATTIFQAADGHTPLREIVRDRVCRQFDVDPEQAQADAEQFVAELSGHGILIVSKQPMLNSKLDNSLNNSKDDRSSQSSTSETPQ